MLYIFDIFGVFLLVYFIYTLIFDRSELKYEKPKLDHIVKRTNDVLALLDKIEKQEELVYYTRLFRWNSKLIGD
jgi:hypothetical protein